MLSADPRWRGVGADLARVSGIIFVLLGDHMRRVVGGPVLVAGVANVTSILHRGWGETAAAGPGS